MPGQSESTRRKSRSLSRRPALSVAICFIVGIALHPALPPWPMLWLLLAALATLLAIAARHLARLASLLLIVSILLAGSAIAQLEAFCYPADDISAYTTDTPRLAWLELKIDHEPRVLSDPFDSHPMPPKQAVTASVLRVKTLTGWRDACGEMLVQIAQPHPRLAMGQIVRVVGQLQRPAPAMNPGQFDWASYYRQQRILTSFHIAHAANITILSDEPIGWLNICRQRTRELLAEGFSASQSLDHALLRALLLGDSDPELRDVQDQFRHTGTSHHLSISGMHVAVLGGVIYFLCRLLRMRPRWAVIFGMTFVAFYGLMALPSAPVWRSVLLCAFFSIGVLLRRARDPIHLLSISVLALLIYHPTDLYNAGFQLSFGVVLGLMVFSRRFIEFMRRLSADEFVVPSANHKKPLLMRATRRVHSGIFDAFCVGLVAWVISMPLIVYHFNQLNPWAIVASLVLAMFVFASLVGGFAKVVLTLLWPSLSAQWALMAQAPVAAMRGVLDWLARIPGSEMPIPQMPLWVLLLCYAIFLLMLLPTSKPKLRIALRFSPVASCMAALLLPLWLSRNPAVAMTVASPAEQTLKLTLLSLGAGECGLVETPSGRTLMIDAGTVSYTDLLGKCINPYLRATRHSSIDELLLTHSDYDHISAAAQVAQLYDVREVLVGCRFREHAFATAPGEALLKSLDALDLPPRVLLPGDRLPIGRDVELDALWPPRNSLALSSNDSALVAQLRYAGRSILITGDIQEPAEKQLMKLPPDQLHANILIAPHHGSSEVTTAAFVRAVNPSIILSSNDRTLTGKQRRFERLIGHASLYRTNICGAITVSISKAGAIHVMTYVHANSR